MQSLLFKQKFSATMFTSKGFSRTYIDIKFIEARKVRGLGNELLEIMEY